MLCENTPPKASRHISMDTLHSHTRTMRDASLLMNAPCFRNNPRMIYVSLICLLLLSPTWCFSHSDGDCTITTDNVMSMYTDMYSEKAIDFLDKELNRERGIPIEQGHFGCIDGRDDVADEFTAPGGDLGEVIPFLQSHETIRGVVLTQSEVNAIIDRYVSVFPKGRRLYHHSDNHAVEHIVEEMHTAGYENFTEDDLMSPPINARPVLLEMLTTDLHAVGCGYLKHLLNATNNRFAIRTELVAMTIKYFFERLWNSTTAPKYYFQILSGDHKEEQVVTIDMVAPPSAYNCLSYGLPFTTRDATDSFFLFHRSLAMIQRWKIATAVTQLDITNQNTTRLYWGLNAIVDILAPTLPKVNVYLAYTIKPEEEKVNKWLPWAAGIGAAIVCSGAFITYIVVERRKIKKRFADLTIDMLDKTENNKQ